MKAIVQHRFGAPLDVLALEEVPDPVAAAGEVVVRVRAAGVNARDWHLVTGLPRVMRVAGMGLRRPRLPVPGLDVAGVVESVGPGVTRLRVGDDVVGWQAGSLAERVVGDQDRFVARPGRLGPVEAAALPLAGSTALQGLRGIGGLEAGQRVLVTGASGGVGGLAVAIAHALGAHVTGACRSENVELVRSLGADVVLDRTRDEVPGQGPYDMILHVAGPTSLEAMRRALLPRGVLVLVNGDGGDVLGPLPLMLRMWLASRRWSQRATFLVAGESHADLVALFDVVEAAGIRPRIERTYDLAEGAAAVDHVWRGRTRGKVVVTL